MLLFKMRIENVLTFSKRNSVATRFEVVLTQVDYSTFSSCYYAILLISTCL
jgi:hypothetical protein